jgi:hypothetical protein
MEHHELVVIIDEKGNVALEVQGVKGKSCLDITADFEEAVGNVLERKLKSEYYSSVEENKKTVNIKQ